MENNETYFVARLKNKGKFLSAEIFESLEEARHSYKTYYQYDDGYKIVFDCLFASKSALSVE